MYQPNCFELKHNIIVIAIKQVNKNIGQILTPPITTRFNNLNTSFYKGPLISLSKKNTQKRCSDYDITAIA